MAGIADYLNGSTQMGTYKNGISTSGGRNSFGVRINDNNNYAASTQARLSRATFDDYMKTYAPFEDRLLAMYNSPELRQEALMNAQRTVGEYYDRMPAQRERYLSGLGVEVSPEQQAAIQRNDALSRSVADVGARNSTLDSLKQRDYALATGFGG